MWVGVWIVTCKEYNGIGGEARVGPWAGEGLKRKGKAKYLYTLSTVVPYFYVNRTHTGATHTKFRWLEYTAPGEIRGGGGLSAPIAPILSGMK